VRKWVGLGVVLVSLVTAATGIALSDRTVGAVPEDSGGPGQGQLKHAESVSVAFGIHPDTALALHQDGVGWGAMVKLLAIAEVKGISIEQLLADIEKVDGGYAFDFGALQASLTPEQREALAEMPKGIGHLGRPHGMPPGHAKNLDNDGS
jgi:hypothetical protein